MRLRTRPTRLARLDEAWEKLSVFVSHGVDAVATLPATRIELALLCALVACARAACVNVRVRRSQPAAKVATAALLLLLHRRAVLRDLLSQTAILSLTSCLQLQGMSITGERKRERKKRETSAKDDDPRGSLRKPHRSLLSLFSYRAWSSLAAFSPDLASCTFIARSHSCSACCHG